MAGVIFKEDLTVSYAYAKETIEGTWEIDELHKGVITMNLDDEVYKLEFNDEVTEALYLIKPIGDPHSKLVINSDTKAYDDTIFNAEYAQRLKEEAEQK